MYSCSPTLSQISLKNSFGKVVFKIFAKIEMTRNKNRLFDRHFETVQHFQIFFAELWFFIVHTYMVQISLQNSAGKVFNTDFPSQFCVFFLPQNHLASLKDRFLKKMRIKRAKTVAFVHKAISSDNYFALIENNFRFLR